MKKSERPQASKHEDGVDFISEMPDAILVLILSRLYSTTEQIRTSILSQRWRYLWTAIPSIHLSICSDEKESEFKEFVYWVLASKTVDLDRFRLLLRFYYNMRTIWRWVHMAVTRNVKQIDMSFWDIETETIELPGFLVSCGSLEVLRLCLMYRGLGLPRFVGFPALRVLHLSCLGLPEDDDLVSNFFKSCPLLEDLSLSDCLIGKRVCILCPKLKRLCIINWGDVGFHGIKISCPELTDLDIGGRRMWEGNTEPVQFHVNSHFKWTYLYFSIEAIGAAPALSNLKTLVLRITLEAFTVDELSRILKYCPKLENLKLIIRKVFDEEGVRLDEAETRRLWTPDVNRVEFFKFKGEKPKLIVEFEDFQMNCTFFWERGRASVKLL